MKHVMTVEGDWAQIWGVIDNLPEHDVRGMTLVVPVRIGPEYAVLASLQLKGFNVEKDPTSFSYIAKASN